MATKRKKKKAASGGASRRTAGSATAVVSQLLKAVRWEHRRRVEDGWTTFVTSVDQGPIDSAVAFVSDELNRVMLYFVFRPSAPKARRPQVAEFITRANSGLGDGNFEMSYSTGEVLYKASLDFSGIPLPPVLVRNLILNAMDVAELYGGALSRVIDGKATASKAIAAVEG